MIKNIIVVAIVLFLTISILSFKIEKDINFRTLEKAVLASGTLQRVVSFPSKHITLDQHYQQFAPIAEKILKAKGYTDKDSKNLFFEGTDHSEVSWQKRLDQPLIFLLGKD